MNTTTFNGIEISLYVPSKGSKGEVEKTFISDPDIIISSTGDGCAGAEITLEVKLTK